MIAALFVAKGGCYFGLPDVDPWDEERDARKYAGPYPVVAHPPCERWGRYYSGGPLLAGTPKAKKLGDDAGCFAAALDSVRRYGGVIEHPAYSKAWKHFGLNAPPRVGNWIPAGDGVGATCHVEQGHYGHRAKKGTWLYAVRTDLPNLIWGPSSATVLLDDGFHSSEERRIAKANGWKPGPRLTKRERYSTPIAFRDILLSMARSVDI